MQFNSSAIILASWWQGLTYLVGCKLHKINFPPSFFFAKRGSLPAGTICSVVPRHIETSDNLEDE